MIAIAYDVSGDAENALVNYDLAIAIYAEIGDTLGFAKALDNSALSYKALAQYSTALERSQAAHEIFRQNAEMFSLALNVGIIGHIYYDMEAYEQALSCYQRRMEIAEKLDDDYLRTTSYGAIGRVYFQLEQLDSAQEWLQKGIAVGERLSARNSLLKDYESISDVFKAQNDFQQALEYFQRYVALKDEISGEETRQYREMLMIEHETLQAQMDASFQKERAEVAEKRAKKDRQYFEELAKMKSEFIFSATHDLKNPLASILLNVHLLRRRIASENAEYLDKIEKQTQRMSNLIANILDLAKLETGSAIQLELASLSLLLEDLFEDYQPIAQDKKIDLHIQLDTDPIFYFDTANLQRALSNLLSNAIKYSPTGGRVTVTASIVGESIHIEIKDRGIGISEADLPHIFKRFYRVNSSAADSIEGTGLGLSIVKSIIDQHGGSIAVKSATGRGTTFTVRLPFVAHEKSAAIASA